MSTTLYEATVERFIQTLTGVEGFLERGVAHCTESGVDPQSIVETRLWSDMAPFRFQVVSVAHHSLGAIEGVRQGLFTPPRTATETYEDLQALVSRTRAALEQLSREEVNALEETPLIFRLGEREIPFLGAGFLLSFSLPNFYFHATTAYDILRSQGAPLGKRHFTGPLRTRT